MENSISKIYRQRLLRRLEEKKRSPLSPNIDRDITFLIICEREAYKYTSSDDVERYVVERLAWAERLVERSSDIFASEELPDY